jgi:poly(3-hydroxybutyrate) depolymerase
VVLDTVVGGTHWWPGGRDAVHDPTDSAAGKTFPATDRILAFLTAHRRTPR